MPAIDAAWPSQQAPIKGTLKQARHSWCVGALVLQKGLERPVGAQARSASSSNSSPSVALVVPKPKRTCRSPPPK